MNTLTFGSTHYAPRRAAVRRAARPVAPAPAQAAQPTALVAVAGVRNVRDTVVRNRAGLAALAGVTLLAHVAIIATLHQPGAVTPQPPKAEPLAIEFAPPPPPPPEPPKPLPQVAKAVPTPSPVRTVHPLPVVSQPVSDGPPAADTVQVATSAAPAPAPAPAPAAAPPAPPEPVTEPRGYAGYRNNPAPEYPALAQDRGLQGRVILNVHVLASGKADNIAVDKSSGHKILDDAAIKAVLAWSFDPARRGQQPIDGWVKVPLNFKLS